MMNIIIPMAGRGKRFKDAGYELPKPFIKVNDEPMFYRRIENIINNSVYEDLNIIIIVLEEHSKFINDINKSMEIFRKRDLVKRNLKYEIIVIPDVTDGAACTALLAKDYLDLDKPTWITDCDHLIYDTFYLQEATSYFIENKAHAGLICHLSDNPKWSYCKISDKRTVYVAEKEVISNIANTGDYFYREANYFIQSAEDMINKNDRSKNEFYLAPTMNYIIKEGGLVMSYMINNMKGLGVPEDLEKFLQK